MQRNYIYASDCQSERGAISAAEYMEASTSEQPFPDLLGVFSEVSEPPYCNTGAQIRQPPENKQNRSSKFSFNFDWYAMTLPAEISASEIHSRVQFLGSPSQGKSMHGYDSVWDYGLFKVCHGGYSGKYGVHVIIHGGDKCQQLVDMFRGWFPDHRPSRLDVCIDLVGPTAWSDLSTTVMLVAKKYGIETRVYGDWLRGEKGRTLYLGGKSSTHKLRLYEKGHEQRQKGIDPEAPLDWVRLEFQVQPTGPARASAASFTANEIARSTKWTSFLCDALGAVSADQKQLTTKKRASDCISSLETMWTQYGAKIHEAIRDGHITMDTLLNVTQSVAEQGEFTGWWATENDHPYRSWMF